ncbi:MAG TPA: inositol monophosphatase family protein [Solirubrobacteraceae bacterium]
MSETEQLLELASRAARMAGGLLAERAAAGAERSVTSKSTPTDLVSEADVAAEHALRELLSRERPQDGFLGEEGGGSDGSSGLTWVVDPLDGTVNFLFGIPQWSVSVAVRDAHGTIAGAVYDANRDELFTARRDGPALLTTAAGAAQDLRGRTGDPHGEGGGEGVLASAMVATGLAYDASVRALQATLLAELAPRVRDIRRFGSAALDLAWTAAGRYDAYFERSVKEWDVAAGVLICQRAGLELRELAEAPGLPWGVLVARPALADALGELVGA